MNADEVPPRIKEVLKRLVQQAGQGQDVRALLVRDPSICTREIADAARTVLEAVKLEQNGPVTHAFTLVTFGLYDALGCPREAWESTLPNLELGFMFADAGPAYVAVARSAIGKSEQASAVGAFDVALQMRVLAADCLFFAAQGAERGEPQARLLKASLEMLNANLQEVDSSMRLKPSWALRLATLAAALVETIVTTGGPASMEPPFEPLLRGLAKLTEMVVPLELTNTPDPARAELASRGLAALSLRFGDPEIARARHGLSSGVERRNMRAGFDVVRGQYRSRVGRLLARQRDADAEGRLLQADVADPSSSDADVFAAIERSKARLLLDQLRGTNRPLTAEAATAAASLERAAFAFESMTRIAGRDDLVARENLLISEQSIGMPTDTADATRREELVAQVEQLFVRSNAGLGAPVEVASLGDVQRTLRDDEALIQYAIPHSGHPAQELHVLAITRADVKRLRIGLDDLPFVGPVGRVAVDGAQPFDMSALGDCVLECRVAIQRNDDGTANRLLARLHGKLVEPLIEAGLAPARFARWILVPHGPLHYVPFGALAAVGGKRLIEQVALTTCPSASSWLHLAARPAAPLDTFLGVANPTLTGSSLPSLAQAEKELEKIDGALSSLARTKLVGMAATEAAVRAAVATKAIVHFATHGEFPELDALDDHRILLTAGGGHDGRLHADEIRALDLSRARLVVLNICNGGLYRAGPGDEPYGLVAALLVSGAQNVLGTLWPVEDRSARTFITYFYRELLTAGPAEAIRRAALQAIALEVRLSQWAGVVAVGPGRPLG